MASARVAELRGPEIHSLIIWVEKGGKFHGIKVHQVWKRGNEFRVVEWVHLDGYESGKDVIKKRAILERETLDSCDYPEWIRYKIEMRNPESQSLPILPVPAM